MDPGEAARHVRPPWIRQVIDGCQAFLGVKIDGPDAFITAMRGLLFRLPAPRTPFEAMVLRGLLAEIALRFAARDGRMPAECVRMLDLPTPVLPAQAPITPSGTHHPKVVCALTLIGAAFHRPDLRLKDIASAVELTPWHLSRLIRKATGSGFAAHVREARLAHAAVLLDSAQRSVKEVAAAVGYKRPGDFSRDFARAFGSTPSVWRRQQVERC